MSKKQIAFTLIELLVVIAIIGILSGLIVVTMSGVTDKANIAKGQVFSNSLRNALMMNLASEWRLDGNGNDSWSGGNNCAWHGSSGGTNTSANYRPSSECVSGQCLNFDGTDDYLDCGNNSSLDITSAITIEAWIKPAQLYTDYYRAIIGKPHYSVYGIFSEWSASGGYLRFEIDSGGARYAFSGPPLSGNIGKWMYVVGTYNSADGILKIYNNGNLYNSLSITAGKAIDTTTNHLLIGGTDSNYFNGVLDNLRIYSSSMPSSRIKEQYYAGLNNLLANGGITVGEYLKRIKTVGYSR